MKQIQFIGVTPTDLLNEIDKRIARNFQKSFNPKNQQNYLPVMRFALY